jgi:hypothetical protein
MLHASGRHSQNHFSREGSDLRRTHITDRRFRTHAARSRPDKALITGLRRAHAELKERGLDMTDRIADAYLRKLTGLAFLAPDIQRAILEGRQPADLKLADLVSRRELPLGWDDQRKLLGFA